MNPPKTFFADYAARLQTTLMASDWSTLALLADDLERGWCAGRRVFLCGNGGSAANAAHLANDLLYGAAMRSGGGVRAQALTANHAVLTCLANDLGYETVFSEQLAVLAEPGDLLIVFSGSGNSPNIVRALEKAGEIGMRRYAVLGFGGGRAKALADVAIHFAIDDMQIAEDMQLVVGHMLMQWLYRRRDNEVIPHG